jgi:hypothetical protein
VLLILYSLKNTVQLFNKVKNDTTWTGFFVASQITKINPIQIKNKRNYDWGDEIWCCELITFLLI